MSRSNMDGRAILRGQIQVLADNLSRVERAVKYQEIDSDLIKRVRISFEEAIRQHREDLENVLHDVDQDLPMDACWDAFGAIRQECEPLFQECLSFVQGALLRSVGLDDGDPLDGGMLEIADALLAHLSYLAQIPWERFTMLAEQEFFYELAEIIRLPFPDASIWDVPISAHEFGHFMGPRIQLKELDGSFRYPFQELLEQARSEDQDEGERQPAGQRWSFLHEQFADVFATYSLGPAFACACLLLRFDPRRADVEKLKHPTDATRAYIILRVLKKMNESESPIVRPALSDIVDKLEGFWKQSLIDANKPLIFDQIANPELDELISELYSILDRKKHSVRYNGLLKAQRLSDELQPDRSTLLKFEKDDTLRDALNAAWLSRIYNANGDGYKIREVARKATELCRKIMLHP